MWKSGETFFVKVFLDVVIGLCKETVRVVVVKIGIGGHYPRDGIANGK